MQLLKLSDKIESLEKVIDTLNSGGVVVYPTETCYGIGVDATNPEAVAKLLKFKKRKEGNAISIAVSSKEMAEQYVELNDTARKIYESFLPGPITIISKSKGKVDQRLESEKATLGIRVPNYASTLKLIEEFGKPISATTANAEGKGLPYSVDDILNALSEDQQSLIDIIIDAGILPRNPASTVIDTTSEDLVTYRHGLFSIEEKKEPLIFETNSVEETITQGFDFAKKYIKDSPIFILLNGELGSGKTHFTKGIAKALGIGQMIKSPSYNYFNEYTIKSKVRDQTSKLIHFDAWRVETKEDLEALGFYNWGKSKNVIVVEWPSVLLNFDEKIFKGVNKFVVEFSIVDREKRKIKIY